MPPVLDLVIVGGGIAGAACAREAARRGLRVAVLEAADVASGTTGASTRLAHGGLRYLQQGDLRQVRHGLRERAWLRRAAPHLVEPMPFLVPIRRGERAFGAALRLGLRAYDGLAPWGWPGHRFLGARETLAAEPALRGEVAGAARFHDGRIRSVERLTLEFLLDAAAHGADVRTGARVEALERSREGWQVHAGDALLNARVVLNCAGPWAERVARAAGIARPLLRATRGSHVALTGPIGHGLVLRAEDGRTFFAVPWNEVTLVGTTDIDEAGDPGAVRASPAEVRYLLEGAGRFVALAGRPAYTTAGVRALVARGGSPGSVPRTHAVLDHAAEGAPGLFSLVGGKITTARIGAADAVDAVARVLRRGRARATDAPLPGAGPAHAGPDGLLGARAPRPERVLCARHATLGMVRLAVEREWCRALPDFMFRRSLAGHAPDLGAHCVDAVAAAMAELLAWGPAEREAQQRAYEAECAARRAGL